MLLCFGCLPRLARAPQVNGNRPADEVSKDVCALFDAPASSAGVGQTGVSVLGLAIAAGLAFMAFSRK